MICRISFWTFMKWDELYKKYLPGQSYHPIYKFKYIKIFIKNQLFFFNAVVFSTVFKDYIYVWGSKQNFYCFGEFLFSKNSILLTFSAILSYNNQANVSHKNDLKARPWLDNWLMTMQLVLGYIRKFLRANTSLAFYLFEPAQPTWKWTMANLVSNLSFVFIYFLFDVFFCSQILFATCFFVMVLIVGKTVSSEIFPSLTGRSSGTRMLAKPSYFKSVSTVLEWIYFYENVWWI